MWDANSDFGKIHSRLMGSLEENEIIAYHNTRLRIPEKIKDAGLIFLMKDI